MSQVTESRSGQFFEAHVSHSGAVRTNNEDAFLARGGEGFWVVADGMGGMDDGEWASRTLAVELAEAPLSGDLQRDASTVGEVVRHANFVIFKESTERQNHIGSTVVSLLVRGPRFAAVWAGDSRLYLRRSGTLRQVTTDHTQVQQMVNAGYMTEREAADHPMSHVLARAVGTHAEVETEVVAGDVQIGDLFLLCSDGLPRVIEDHEIARELESGNPAEMVRRLLDIALERGAPDNITILVIGCGDPSGAMGAAMAATAPILGGAADDSTPPPAAAPEPKTEAVVPGQPPKKAGGAVALLAGLIGLLVVGAIGVGAFLMGPKLRHPAARTGPVVVVEGKAPVTGLRQFEAALGTVDCSWLQIEKVSAGAGGVDLEISGVAASPTAVQGALQAAATAAKVQVADIDLRSIAPAPPALCSTLNALRPFRAATSETGQNLTAAQDSFAVMKQADGKEAGRAVVTATPPPQGDFAVAELGDTGDLSLIAADRQTFQTMASAGTVVSKVPDGGGYRLQADYAKPGWSSVMLITGKGPFPRSLLTQAAGQRNGAWASQFGDAARAGGWKIEMAWYDITTGADLSVIPETQAASNAILPPTNGLVPIKPPPKKPAETNAAAVLSDANATAPPPTNAAAPSKAATPDKGKPPTKSDVPL